MTDDELAAWADAVGVAMAAQWKADLAAFVSHKAREMAVASRAASLGVPRPAAT